MIDDSVLLAKYKQAKMSDADIAAKLGIKVEEVEQRWQALLAAAHSAATNGTVELANQLNILALQYQLVGESLKILTTGLGKTASPEDIRACVVPGNADQTVKNLVTRFTIIHPFKLIDPVEALKLHQRNQ